MAFRKENEILYTIFKQFIKNCLVEDKSLLWPDREVWTKENLVEIKKRFFDSPIFGTKQSFHEKLVEQMKGASANLWVIIADIYFVYFIPSTFITFEKKKNDIRWSVEQGGLPEPVWSDDFVKAQASGFTRTSQRYHYKYSQFWFIILAALELKNTSDIKATVESPAGLKVALDEVLGRIPNKLDRAYDMRHAFLYMALPDRFERIISTRDKERIVRYFSEKISATMPSDVDDALLKIRENLAPQYGAPDKPMDFYQADLKAQWRLGQDVPANEILISEEIGPVTVPDSEELTVDEEGRPTEHTRIQFLLLKLGNDMGLDLWVARNDKNKSVDGVIFSDFKRLKSHLPVKFDEITTKIIEMIDVLWLKGNAILAAFEIESTTSIYSGLLRMADLISMQPNINIPLFIVAPDDRKKNVKKEINRPLFSSLSPPMREICRYISFSTLTQWISKNESVVRYIKPDFLEEISEDCEINHDAMDMP